MQKAGILYLMNFGAAAGSGHCGAIPAAQAHRAEQLLTAPCMTLCVLGPGEGCPASRKAVHLVQRVRARSSSLGGWCTKHMTSSALPKSMPPRTDLSTFTVCQQGLVKTNMHKAL